MKDMCLNPPGCFGSLSYRVWFKTHWYQVSPLTSVGFGQSQREGDFFIGCACKCRI